MVSTFDMVENIVGKGENAGNLHFLLFSRDKALGWLVKRQMTKFFLVGLENIVSYSNQVFESPLFTGFMV